MRGKFRKGNRSDSVLWKKPLYLREIQKTKVTTQNATQMFDNTAVADRRKTVS